jgi:hypothetical protein
MFTLQNKIAVNEHIYGNKINVIKLLKKISNKKSNEIGKPNKK